MAEIDSLDIKISAEDNAASKKITALAGALEKLDKALASGGMSTVVKSMEALNKSSGGLSTVEKAMKSVSDAANGIGKSVEAMKGVGALLQQLGNVGKIELSENLPKRLTEIGEAMQSISPESLERLDAMTQSLSRLQGVSLGLRDVAKAIPETGNMDASALSNTLGQQRIVENGTRVSSLFSSVSGAAKNAVDDTNKFSSALSSLAVKVLPKVGSGLKTLGKSIISQVTKPFKSAISTVGKWKSAIGRIVFYQMIRSAIRMITEGFSTGIKNLYEYSRLAGTEFAPAMNALSTNALYLKNSLGAMAAPLIQAVVPAVETVIDAFVRLLNIIGKVFAALSGKSTYTQAKKYATEYGDALNGAAGAAKALKDYTLGFDELNVFNDNGSGGGGGGGSGMDYGSMFEEVEVPSAYSDWAENIRRAIENGDWNGAGKALAQKLNELIDKWNPKAWGKKLGKTITNGLNAANGFLSNFDFEELGGKISEWLNGALSTIDFSLLGETLASTVNAIPAFLYGLITKTDWKKAGSAISNVMIGLFSNIKWSKIKSLLQKAIQSVGPLISGFFSNLGIDGSKLETAFTSISDALGPLLDMIGNGLAWAYENVLLPLADWTISEAAPALLETLANALNAIATVAGPAMNGIGKIWDALQPAIQWIEDTAVEVIEWLGERFRDAAKIFEEKGPQIEKIFSNIGDALSGAWGLIEPILGSLKELVGDVFSYITQTADLGPVIDTLASLTDALREIINFLQNVFKGNWKGAWESIKKIAVDIWESMKSAIAFPLNAIIGFFETLVNGIVTALNALIGMLNSLSFDMPDWLGGAHVGFNLDKLEKVSIPRLENGGFVKEGELFIAREKGPEFVGSIGNRTAVANNYQIESGISNGVAQANQGVIDAIMDICYRLIAAIEENRTSVQIGDEDIYKANRRYEQRTGTNTTKGAFAYVR